MLSETVIGFIISSIANDHCLLECAAAKAPLPGRDAQYARHHSFLTEFSFPPPDQTAQMQGPVL